MFVMACLLLISRSGEVPMGSKLKILRLLGIVCFTFVFAAVAHAQQPTTGFLGFGANSCILNYVSGATHIQRFNICTGQPLSDFDLTQLPDPRGIRQIQSLPDGGILVSNFSVIARFDRNAKLIRVYEKAGEDCWSGLALEPDGRAFWAASSCQNDVTRFDLTLDPHMFGGGSEFMPSGIVNYGLDLHCDVSVRPNYLQVIWDGGTFMMKNMTAASCLGSPFNTHTGTGDGTINGQAGAQAQWVFVDNGEPGVANDSGKIVIKNASGQTVLSVSGKLTAGGLVAK
jgi:hypothetical protein